MDVKTKLEIEHASVGLAHAHQQAGFSPGILRDSAVLSLPTDILSLPLQRYSLERKHYPLPAGHALHASSDYMCEFVTYYDEFQLLNNPSIDYIGLG